MKFIKLGKRVGDFMELIRVNQFSGLVPVEREFNCRQCGTNVKVTDKKDKRTVFCSQKCEKKYWRLKSKEAALHKKRGREKKEADYGD